VLSLLVGDENKLVVVVVVVELRGMVYLVMVVVNQNHRQRICIL